MKIIQVTAIDVTMNDFIYPLNKASEENGFEVHCVCSEGEYTQKIKNDGFYFHQVQIDRKINLIKNAKSIINMVKMFKSIKPDIVHVHTPVASVLARIAAKIAKVPNIIYTAHGFYFHEGMSKYKYNIFFFIEKIIGRFFTDYILTQSKEDYEIAKSHSFLKQKSNVIHISNGIDLKKEFNPEGINQDKIEEMKIKHNINDNNLVVTFIGRLVKEKGIIEFLESFKKIKTDNIKYIIIGGLPQGERDQEAIKVIEKFKNNPDIIFTDYISNVKDYLYISDIFCLPSYREGMPRSIIEAMAMKNAILATNIRGSREEVIHGETGFLFDLYSSNKIAEYVELLNDNKEKLRYMQESSYERAKQLYDENNVIKTQIKLYRRITNKL
ncbi:glycosyltransferase family 4 protein [Staphylococcus equorum]|uniref:glycosyltransferase family 4 protein n=1 Tax=Staphylococcus equorum TaxID=246432 RepID=UPI002DBDC976|nr:glycosyltransferase family 4 protein [Staphylococcus equorum]MEB8108833.1 glycosyltransferase family 4 protein [Staphylococcus equorum]